MKPVCLVTGAGGRLGQDLCMALKDDYNLVAIYHKKVPNIPSQFQWKIEERANGLEKNTEFTRGSIYLVQADLSCRKDIKRIVEVALARFGQIDALINSAADIKFHGNLRDIFEADDYPQSQMHLNATVPMLIASAVYQYCWKHKAEKNIQWNRSVVNVSSVSGLYANEPIGQAYYGVSKAALNMLTLYQSLELAPYGVRVNAICPSRFTSKAATRRVTEAIIRLLSGDSTGSIITKIP